MHQSSLIDHQFGISQFGCHFSLLEIDDNFDCFAVQIVVGVGVRVRVMLGLCVSSYVRVCTCVYLGLRMRIGCVVRQVRYEEKYFSPGDDPGR